MKNRTIKYFAALLLAMVIIVGKSKAQEEAAPTSSPTAPPKGATVKAPAPASNYTWTTPITGMPTIPVWKRGSTYNLTWTGGPVGPVKLYLVNWCTWTAQLLIVASAPNNHHYSWTVPSTLPCGVFECYIQNASGPPTAWSYSMNFAITKP